MRKNSWSGTCTISYQWRKIEDRFSTASIDFKLLVLDKEFALAPDVTMIFISELRSIYTEQHTGAHTHTFTQAPAEPKLSKRTQRAFRIEKNTFLIASHFGTDLKAHAKTVSLLYTLHYLIFSSFTHRGLTCIYKRFIRTRTRGMCECEAECS